MPTADIWRRYGRRPFTFGFKLNLDFHGSAYASLNLECFKQPSIGERLDSRE
jgi:hypothetical protein